MVALTALAGCGPSGPKLYPVEGTVELGGKPAENAIIFLHRNGRNEMLDPLPFGTSNASGKFEIETPSIGKGAQEGDYKITAYVPDMTKPEDGNGQRPDALNGAYEKVNESQLNANIKSGKNELPLLKLVPGPPKSRPQSDKNNK